MGAHRQHHPARARTGSSAAPVAGVDAVTERIVVGWRRPLRRLPAALGIAVLVVGALSLGLPNVAPDVAVLAAEGSPVRRFFGVSEEMNLPTFLSVVLLLLTAATHAFVGRLVGGRTGVAFLATALALLLLAFDDFTALHERLNGVSAAFGVGDSGGTPYFWVVPASVVGLAVVAVFVRLGRWLVGPARRDLLLGIALFLGAAFVLEAVSGLLDRPGTDGMPLQLVTHVEEALESLGVVLLLRAALRSIEVAGAAGQFRVRLAAQR